MACSCFAARVGDGLGHDRHVETMCGELIGNASIGISVPGGDRRMHGADG